MNPALHSQNGCLFLRSTRRVLLTHRCCWIGLGILVLSGTASPLVGQERSVLRDLAGDRYAPAASHSNEAAPTPGVRVANRPTQDANGPRYNPLASPQTLGATNQGGQTEPPPPSADSAPSESAEVESFEIKPRAAALKGVQPGTTGEATLQKVWGPPERVQTNEFGSTYIYKMEPFKQVRVEIEAGVVQGIQLDLANRPAPEQLAQQLHIEGIRSTSIRDEEGTSLGLAFPERAVVFTFAPDETQNRVSHVLLEQLSASPFTMRANEVLHGPYQENIADLKYAITLDADNEPAWLALAECYLAVGQPTAAQSAIRKALSIKAQSKRARLLHCQALYTLNQADQALELAQQVADSPSASPLEIAEALLRKGEIQSSAASPTDRRAYESFVQAIQHAETVARSKNPTVKTSATRLLVMAHLRIAREVARGAWKQKEDAIGQWIDRAKLYADGLSASPHEDAFWKLIIAQEGLAAWSAIAHPIDPQPWIDQVEEATAAALASSDDPLWQSRVRWHSGLANMYALRLAHAGSQTAQALQFGEAAIDAMSRSAPQREASAIDKHLVGLLYFQLGAVHAIHRQDTEQAMVWYDRARPILSATPPQHANAPLHPHADALVSMGVTYWQAGNQQQGIALTEAGERMLQDAVNSGQLSQEVLEVASSNLAAMHGDTKPVIIDDSVDVARQEEIQSTIVR